VPMPNHQAQCSVLAGGHTKQVWLGYYPAQWQAIEAY
jgi:hypothetical protein